VLLLGQQCLPYARAVAFRCRSPPDNLPSIQVVVIGAAGPPAGTASSLPDLCLIMYAVLSLLFAGSAGAGTPPTTPTCSLQSPAQPYCALQAPGGPCVRLAAAASELPLRVMGAREPQGCLCTVLQDVVSTVQLEGTTLSPQHVVKQNHDRG